MRRKLIGLSEIARLVGLIALEISETTPVEVRVVEHLYRATNRTISTHSDPFLKTDANTAEFRVTIAPDAEKIVTYTAHDTR